MVRVIAGLNAALAAPVSCISIAPEVEVKVVKPVGAGTPLTPEKVVVESAGAVKVNDGAAVIAFVDPSAFFAVMTVLGASVTVTAPRYPGVPGGVATVVVFAPVVAVPSVLIVAAIRATVDGFVTTGASSPPPQLPIIIKAPNKAAKLTIFDNLLIFNPPLSKCFT